MLFESIAILFVYLLLIVVFLRSRHVGYAVAVVPVGIIPAVYILTRAVFYFPKGNIFGARPEVALAFVEVIALAASCAAIMLISRRIQSKANRRLYLVVMLIYAILLGWAYIYNALHPFLIELEPLLLA